jgi:hypothetical protein
VPKYDKKSTQKPIPFPEDYNPDNNVQVDIPIALIPILGAYIDRWASKSAWNPDDFEKARQASILLQERLIPKTEVSVAQQEHHITDKHEWKTGTMLIVQGKVQLPPETGQQIVFNFPFSSDDYHVTYTFIQAVSFNYTSIITQKTANSITIYSPAFQAVDVTYLLIGYSA